MAHQSHLVVSVLGLAAAAFAQAPDVSGLRSLEWQVRNATAKALLENPAVQASDLFKVMTAEWDDGITTEDRWNSAVGLGGSVKEPRSSTLRKARELTAWISRLSKPKLVTKAQDLTVPFEPQQLAEWLLCQRASKQDLPDLEPSNIQFARIWLTLHKPSQDELRLALAEPATATPTAIAMWELSEQLPPLLLEQLANGPIAARRAVVNLRPELELLQTVHIRAIVDQFLNDDDEQSAGRAASLLVALKERGAIELIPYLAERTPEQPKAAAVLCLMGAAAKPATEALLACLKGDRNSQRRALVALSDIDIAPELRATVAEQVFELLTTTKTRLVRTVAIDALANCGDGVNAELKARLAKMFDERQYRSVRTRMLGCLRRLQCMPKLATKDLVRIANGAYPTTDTFLAVADRAQDQGTAATLEMCFRDYLPGVDKSAVAAVLVKTAPELLKEWQSSEIYGQRRIALATLQAKRPDLLNSKILLAAIGHKNFADDAFDAICAHPRAKALLPKILAATADSTVFMNAERAKLLQGLEPGFGALLKAFENRLRKGEYWIAVRGLDNDRLQKHARQWIDQEQDPSIRDQVRGESVQLGITQEVDLQMFEQALRSKHREHTLRVMSWQEQLPRELIPALQAICDDPVNRQEHEIARKALRIASRQQ